MNKNYRLLAIVGGSIAAVLILLSSEIYLNLIMKQLLHWLKLRHAVNIMKVD